MFKLSEKVKTVLGNTDIKPVPTGNVSLADFIASDEGVYTLLKVFEMDEDARMFGFLCFYQVYEIRSALQKNGRLEFLIKHPALDELQGELEKFIRSIVSEHYFEMMAAIGGQLSNLLAQEEAKKGGV